MKISALNSLSSTLTADAQANSYLIINNAADSSTTPVTYKVSLTHAGQALSNNLKLVNYDATNQELKAYSISNDAYTNAAIGHYLSAEQVTKLGAISAEANKANIAYDGTNKKITKTIDGTTSDVVTAATLKTDMAFGTAADKNVPVSGNASTTEVVMGNDTRLTDARNAADVYEWAKASTKPTYTAQEVGALPSTTTIPDVSGLAPIASPAFTGSISLNRKTGTTAGDDSLAVGYHTAANGDYSTAIGRDTEANGTASFSGGENTIAAGGEEFVIGSHNALPASEWEANTAYAQNDYVVYQNKLYYCSSAHTSAATFAEDSGWYHARKYLFTVGNGNNASSKSNAFVVDLYGNGRFNGDLYVGCNADSTGGSKVIAIPEPPTTDGTYTLQVVVSSGEATYSWV